MIFTDIKTNIRVSLNDLGVRSYSVTDLDDSVQDAYDDVICQSQCIVKKVTLNWTADLSYYDFSTLIPALDYLGCIAIYNNVNSRWLDDDRNTKNFDQFSDRWETINGAPTNWAAIDSRRVAFYPKYSETSGTFDLYYWATAPTVVDASTPLLATDFQDLLEEYSTFDLLEQYNEFSSAANYWKSYTEKLEEFKERTKNLVKTDLLLRI